MEELNNKKIEEEINFKNVLKTPIRWFGIIYPYFLFLIVVGGLYYVSNLNSINENKIKPAIIDSTRLKTELPVRLAVKIEGVKVQEIAKPTAELISKGRELYFASCASCHGNEGRGDGVAGAGLVPPPRNFLEKDNWTNGMTLADMFKTLEEGISGTGMAAYEYMPVADRFAIIHFIHSLMGEYPENTPDELEQLNIKYKLAEGRTLPNQIPVEKALKIISEENLPTLNKAIAYGKVISVNQNKIESLAKAISKEDVAAYYLTKNDLWRRSNNEFKEYVALGLPTNGFKAGVYLLSEEELTQLRTFLADVIK
jgi:mono/diheme cytochrome c family protein